MSEQVRLDNEELQAAVQTWRAAVPSAVAHPPMPMGASDPASMLAASLCAPWPEMDAAHDTARIGRADEFHTKEFITGADLDSADVENAQRFNEFGGLT